MYRSHGSRGAGLAALVADYTDRCSANDVDTSGAVRRALAAIEPAP
jgi:hypothetical protein